MPTFRIPNPALYVTSALMPPSWTRSCWRIRPLRHFPRHQCQSLQAPLKKSTSLRTTWTSRILASHFTLPIYRQLALHHLDVFSGIYLWHSLQPQRNRQWPNLEQNGSENGRVHTKSLGAPSNRKSHHRQGLDD